MSVAPRPSPDHSVTISPVWEGLVKGFGDLIPQVLVQPRVLAWFFGVSLVMFVGSLVLMPVLVARIRSDYFVTQGPPDASWTGRHPAARVTGWILKNAVGVVLLLAGLAMMVLPGQGIMTILVAMTLLNFPGKRRLELYIIRQRPVKIAVDWIRRRAGQPPLEISEPGTRPND